jgi:hypothetical protein
VSAGWIHPDYVTCGLPTVEAYDLMRDEAQARTSAALALASLRIAKAHFISFHDYGNEWNYERGLKALEKAIALSSDGDAA